MASLQLKSIPHLCTYIHAHTCTLPHSTHPPPNTHTHARTCTHRHTTRSQDKKVHLKT